MTETAIASPLTPMQTFQQNLQEKLRNDIANLLPPEALAEMVQRVVNDEFFKKRRVPTPGRGHYSTDTVEAPSAFEEMVLKETRPVIKLAVDQVLVDNAEAIRTKIDAVIKSGLISLTMNAIDDAIADRLSRVGYEVTEAIKSSMGRG